LKISVARVEVLVWVLIYAGLLVFGLGLALRDFDAVLGHVLWIAGAVIAAAGVVLIAVRARMVAEGSKSEL
jgi:vacuolar-type H+-ATPase subunit I/STV1